MNIETRPYVRMHLSVLMCQYLQNVGKAPTPTVQPINEILGREGKLCKEENYTNVVETCQLG